MIKPYPSDNSKLDYRTLLNLPNKSEPTKNQSTAFTTGTNIMNTPQGLRKLSDATDLEFKSLRNQAFGDPEELKKQDLEKFRQQKELLNIGKTDEEKLIDKFFLEIKYRDENERRANAEIEDIKSSFSVMEKFITTTKDIEMKREMSNLLTERGLLAKLERELYEDVVKFKTYYDKLEYERYMGKQLTGAENMEKLQTMNDIKVKKEQIDYERHRLKSNYEALKAGELEKFKKVPSELLKSAEKRRNNYSSDFSLNPTLFSVNNLKNNMSFSSNRIVGLKRERENFLKNENRFNDELEREEEKNDWLEELTGALTTRDKAQKPTVPILPIKSVYTRSMAELNTTATMPMSARDRHNQVAGDAFSTRFSAYDNKGPATARQLPPSQQQELREQQPGKALVTNSHGPQKPIPARAILGDPLTEYKLGKDKISKLLGEGHMTLHDLQYKFANGQTVSQPGPNGGFGKDAISLEEKQLQEYALQEQELLSTLYTLPSGSYLYQQTYNKIAELSILKTELEKVIREQKLSRGWEVQNQKKDPFEEKRKNERSLDLKKKMFGVRFRGYDINAGFVLNFEWISVLPKDYNYCQVVYGVYAIKEILTTPSLMSFHKCDTHLMRYKKCVFDEKYYIYDVVPIPTALLIFQVEAHFAANAPSNERVEVLGWTMVDLFTEEGELKRGKWKLPVYLKPSNSAITVDEIKFLRRIKDLWLYIRILLPDDEDFLTDGSRPIEALALEHEIPEIHARWLEETKPFEDRPITRNEDLYGNSYMNKTVVQEPSVVDDDSGDGKTMNTTIKERPETEEDSNAHKNTDSEPKKPMTSDKSVRDVGGQSRFDINLLAMKGLKITVVGLKDYTTLNKFRVNGALMDGNQVIMDENNKKCTFSTNAKLLKGLNRNALDLSRADISMVNLKGGNKVVELNQQVLFLKNLPGLIASKQNRLDIILIFQVLEAENGEKTEMMDTTQNKTMINRTMTRTTLNNTTRIDKTMMGDEEDDDEEGNVKDLGKDSQKGYQIASWFAMKLNREDGSLTYGRFEKPLYFEPIVKPPFDEAKLPRTETTIDFIIEEYDFDAEALARQRKERRDDKKGDGNANVNKKEKKKPEWVLDPRPFIINTKRQYFVGPFEKGNGIDFYIDGARFLPDNVTVTKVILTILTQSMEKIAVQAGLPVLTSTTFSPIYKFKKELRAPHFDPTAIAFISLETVDKMAEQVRTVGYCAMNLFLNGKTREAPTSEADNDVLLLNGNYQLPIYCQEPYRKRPFNMQRMVKLDRMPCASLLVRVYKAPKTDDGLKVLSKEDVPEKDWEKKGVWHPAPPYGAGLYNTSFCNLRDSEKELFSLRQQREDPILKTTAAILMNSEGIDQEMEKEEEVLDWLDEKIAKTTSTEIIDLQFFAKYQPKSGFKFALDGFHNVQDKSIPYIGLYCLNPPAALYQTPINSNLIHLNSNYNWDDSAAASPQFLEGFVTFKDVKFDKNLTIIIDIQTIVFKKKTVPTFKPIGWTVLQVFSSNGYVQSGIYQLPIFQGIVPKDIVEQLPLNDPWPYLMEQMAMKKSRVKYLEPMSAIVRLLDSQREGHFQKTFDYERMDYRYLPKKKIGTYAYNVAVDTRLQKARRLTTIVPASGDPKAYNKKITAAFVTELGLVQYQLE